MGAGETRRRSRRQRVGWAGAMALCGLMVGCDDDDERADGLGPWANESAAAAAAAAADPGLAGADQARRPKRRYFLANEGGRCSIYWMVGDRRRPTSMATICPRDLEPGEWLRLAGRTCLREGGGRARTVPVRCPDPLTNAEKLDRADAAWPEEED